MGDIPEAITRRAANSRGRLWERIRAHPLARIGPGLVTGVADDDPSGIATYSQAGAQFGLNMLWTMPLAYPSDGRDPVHVRAASAGSPGKDSPPTSRPRFPQSFSEPSCCYC
jgi:hypothetical protein